MARGIVALVGAPNVGKSTIFNRILKEKKAIVDDQPGVTRDRLYGVAEWLTKTFTLIDTGGIEVKDAPFQTQIRMQVEIAIDEADLIIYVADGKLGVTKDDIYASKMLKKAKKKVILAVNKIDDFSKVVNIHDFYALGLGEPLAISSAHGIGMGDLLDKVIQNLPEKEMDEYENHPTQKPIALLERIIKASSNIGDVVLDPFSGTFTTSYVAKNLKRKSIGIELQDEYIKIGLRRLELATEYKGVPIEALQKVYKPTASKDVQQPSLFF